MSGPMARPTAALGIVLLALGLGACSGESLRSRIDAAIVRLDAAVARLGDDLDAGRLRNAELMRQYADRVRDARPDLRDLVDVLAREGTRAGTIYRSLETRLDDVRKALPDAGARDEAYAGAVDELNSLARAVVPAEFDRALADPLNVLADLSDGALPRSWQMLARRSRHDSQLAARIALVPLAMAALTISGSMAPLSETGVSIPTSTSLPIRLGLAR